MEVAAPLLLLVKSRELQPEQPEQAVLHAASELLPQFCCIGDFTSLGRGWLCAKRIQLLQQQLQLAHARLQSQIKGITLQLLRKVHELLQNIWPL